MKKEKEKKTVLPEFLLKDASLNGKKMSADSTRMPFLYFSLEKPKASYVKATEKKNPLYRLIKIKN